jgi:hypothetical protein
VNRLACLALALVVVIAYPAHAATRVEVHTDVTRGQISFQNKAYAVSGPAPFVTELPAGRYQLFVSTGGRKLGTYVVDVDHGIHLRGGRWSRMASSALIPGSGQFRDDGWFSGTVVGGSVVSLLGRAIYLDTKAGGLREESDPGNIPPSDGLRRLAYDAEVLERSRDDYLILSGAFYIANLVDGVVRRGSIRFREAGPTAITGQYLPTGTGQTMLLSALWPGLGQMRQGRVNRARVWNLASLSVAFFWGEAQNKVERARSDRDFFAETNSPSDPGYYETLGRLQGDVQEQEAVTRTIGYVGLAVWAYNMVDAALVSRQATADSGEMVSNDREQSSWSVAPGLVGENAGLVLGWKF